MPVISVRVHLDTCEPTPKLLGNLLRVQVPSFGRFYALQDAPDVLTGRDRWRWLDLG